MLLNEILKPNIFSTQSIINTYNILFNNIEEKKLILCPDTNYWIIGNSINIVHNTLLDFAFDNNLTSLKNYYDFGIFYFKPYTTTNINNTLNYISENYIEPDIIKIFPTFIIGYNKNALSDNNTLNLFNSIFNKELPLTTFIEA